MLRIDLAVLVLSAVQYSTLQSYSDDFAFPSERSDDFVSCTFANGTVGRCVEDCPNVLLEYQLGIKPTLCHFDDKVPVVCCLTLTHSPVFENATTDDPNGGTQTRRKSAASCDDSFSDLVVPPVAAVIPVATVTPVATVKPVAAAPLKLIQIQIQNEPAIVRGLPTLEAEFPHMAALGWTDESKKITWRCGGTLISRDFVLTAAHCVIGREPPDTIRIGAKDLFTIDQFSPPQDFNVQSIIGHPSYIPKNFYNDIALIKLNQSAIITRKVRPACLWQENSINFTDVTAIGYGDTEFGGLSSNELLKVDLKIVNNNDCRHLYQNKSSLNFGIVDSQLCAGDSENGKDTCQGDSGGPIFVNTTNRRQVIYHIVGITSFGKACALQPGVYTRVSHYLDWIESIVW